MSRPVNVLIPMAGQGKRFRRAGYTTYKPFVPIFGKPMIQYVLDAFPEHVRKFVLTDRTLLTPEQVAFLVEQPGVVLVDVAAHEHGPAYSIFSARESLPLDESFFIAYCDIHWTWDYSAVERLLDHDGVVFTRRSFHPHLVGNNFSAFCRPHPEDANRLMEIREKSSFTDDWMHEPLSIGAFYIKDGAAMIAAIEQLMLDEARVNGEFFPSLIFNGLLAAGADVRLSDVDFFVHWGVPEQLADVCLWVDIAQRVAASPPQGNTAMNVCCMGGAGVRMQHVASTPKALMPVPAGLPMFRYVADQFGAQASAFIVNRHMAPRLRSAGVATADILDIGEATDSQLATLCRAAPFLQRQAAFFLTSCDAFGLWDRRAFSTFLDRVQPDAVVFTFKPTLVQRSLGGSHTFVRVRDEAVVSVHIKQQPDTAALGLAGFFWFRDGSVFGRLDEIAADAHHEMCADHVLKHMVDRGGRVAAYPLDAYIHLGSPAEFDEFAFWHRYHTTLIPPKGQPAAAAAEYAAW